MIEGQVHEERQEDDAGNKSKSPQHHVRVFTYALRHKWMTTNPVAEVRQSAKRERVPSRLTAEELGSLLTQLDLMYSVMILLLVPTGMRRGEILALEWRDVDWQQETLNVRKSIWHQELGPVKTVDVNAS